MFKSNDCIICYQNATKAVTGSVKGVSYTFFLPMVFFPLQSSLVDQGMPKEDSNGIIDKVTRLSGDLHHSVMMAKQFLKEVTQLGYKQ